MAINNGMNINTSTPLDLPRGGTSASLTASNGGIVYSTASAMAILSGTATANQIILSGAGAAPSFSTATYLPTLVANQLVYASATNTMAQLASAVDGVLVTDASSVPSIASTLPLAVQANITEVGILAAGTWEADIIVGEYGGTGIANTGLTINLASGAAGYVLTSDASGNAAWAPSPLEEVWVNQTSTPVTALAGRGYIINNGASQVVITLPVAPALGAVIEVIGFSAGGWQILPGAGQSVQIGAVNGAVSVTSANRYDTLRLIYNGSALWIMASGVSNGYTIL